MGFSSQFGEDKFLREHLKLPDFGVFCEVGAYDGVSGSNTLYFEQSGWTGFLVEPDPELGALCREKRTSPTFICAVGTGPDEQPFFVNKTDRGASGLKVPGDPITVEVRRLDELINAMHIRQLDLLSVDTEGTEVDVLNTLGQFQPTIIIAEFWSQPAPANPEPLLAWASEHGYKEIHRTTANLILELCTPRN